MKKLIVLSIAFCLIFLGCEKEGVYNPDKKIKRVYTQEDSYKELKSEWTWEKNLLKKIEYYWGGSTPEYDERYVYEKNQLIRVDLSFGYYWKVSYKNNLYDKVELLTPEGMSFLSVKFTYEKKKISEINLTFFDYDDYIANIPSGGFMSGLFSPELMQGMQKMASKSKSKADSYTYKISFTYDKNNIKERVLGYTEPGYSWKFTYKFEKYDNKTNPLYRFYTQPYVGEGSFESFVGSKNNPLEIIVIEEDGDYYSDRWTITYDYSYDGKFPTEVIRREDSWRTTTFYEYY